MTTIALLKISAENSTAQTFTFDGYTVDYSVTNSWGNTEVVSLTLTNTGSETIEDWMLYFDPHGSVQYATDATIITADNGISYFKNNGYNANIESNKSVTFSYTVDNEESIPDNYVFCQTRVNKTEGYDVTLTVNQEWDNSFNGTIKIKNNTDKPIEMWELSIDTNFTIEEITNSWAATVTELDNYKYKLKGTYTSYIASNSYVELGFIGKKNGDPEIGDHSLTEISESKDIFDSINNTYDYAVSDLEKLNENSFYPLEVTKNDEGLVTSIDGKFSKISVTDEESALSAISNVKTLLGISDPQNELVLDFISESHSADFKSYFFNQVNNDKFVYGRGVTIVVRNSGEALSLSSNFLPIKNMNYLVSITKQEALDICNGTNAQDIIYSFDKYESTPENAYLCSTNSGNVIISAVDEEIIYRQEKEFYDGADDIYNVKNYDLRDRNTGNIVYHQGKFGDVVENEDRSNYILLLTSSEKNDLNINGTNEISFKYAAKGVGDYVIHSVSSNEYDNFVKEKRNIVDTRVALEDNSRDIKYVDVKADVYHFNQYYKGYYVYGREISIVENDIGTSIRMDSNIFDKDKLDSINIPNFISTSEITKSNNLLSNCILERDDPVIYTWENYNNNPKFVYIYLDYKNNRTYLVDSNTGKVLNENDDSYQLGKGLDEGQGYFNGTIEGMKLQYFPIKTDGSLGAEIPRNIKDKTYNNDITVKISNYHSEKTSSNVTEDEITGYNTYFYEPEAVSAYCSILKSYNFYANEPLYHASYDNNKKGNNTHFTLIVKEQSTNTGGYTYGGDCHISRRSFGHVGYGTHLQVIGHEYTHSVFNSFNNIHGNYSTTSSAISEGYAGLMGHMINEWKEYSYDYNNGDRQKFDFESSSVQYLTDNGMENAAYHEADYFIYTIHQMLNNEMSADELKILAYASMQMGKYSLTSNLNSIRINFIKAAKALRYSDSQLKNVTDTFNEFWNNDPEKKNYVISVEDYNNSTLNLGNVKITLKDSNNTYSIQNNSAFTQFSGWYTVNVTADGYVPYNYRIYLGTEGGKSTIKLVKNDNSSGTVQIKVIDYINSEPVNQSVTLCKLDENLNEAIIGSYNTGESVGMDIGLTDNILLAPGYYMIKINNGYHIFYHPLIVSSGEIKSQEVYVYYDVNLNPNEISDIFYINVKEYRESDIAKEFNICNISADHYADNSGEQIARIGSDTGINNRIFYFYVYERSNENFTLYLEIDKDQAEILNKIRNEETEKTNNDTGGHDYTGELFNLEIEFSRYNNSEYKQTMVFTANDIQVGKNEIANIHYDKALQKYSIQPVEKK